MGSRLAYAQCCLCKIAPGLINQLVLRKQNQFKLVSVSRAVSKVQSIKEHVDKKGLHQNLKLLLLDFPGGAVVKNPPANAGDMGSSPGRGRSHMLRKQLSLCATTTEPAP